MMTPRLELSELLSFCALVVMYGYSCCGNVYFAVDVISEHIANTHEYKH